MDEMMVLRAEKEAKEKAIKQVAAMLQRPDQLDKVEQYRRRIARKKASVEARLKAAVQSQLDGVKTGLSQMSNALHEVKEIKIDLNDVDDMYFSCASLSDKMRDIKDISAQHRQLGAAMENLKHIFSVPEEVAKARDLLKDGQLLQVHKILTDLETSRDDLMYEQYKLENHSESDIKQLRIYFEDAEQLADELAQALWRVLEKTLTLARKNSSTIVTALRIIERENRADTKMMEQERHSGFQPPGRPRNWREQAMITLKQSVDDRIDSDVYNTREGDKMWLVRHLEILRKNTLDDLRVVNFLCVPCFPPAYNIFEKYTHWYHLSLSSHIQYLIKDRLEGNEIISLLMWLNNYTGKDFMGHVELSKLDPSKLPPLLDDSVSEELMQSYFLTTEQNMAQWTAKSLQKDSMDWRAEQEPERDVDGFCRTSLPVILFQMIQQTVQVAETISDQLKVRVFEVCIDEMNKFVRSYGEAIMRYKDDHFQDREKPMYYTLYMVAVTNNCEAFIELGLKFQMDMERGGTNTTTSEFELLQMDREESTNPFEEEEEEENDKSKKLFEKFRIEMDHVAQATCGFLLDEVFLDLKPYCDSLFQRSWLDGDSAVDTICVTIEDYYGDYVHLKSRYFSWIMKEAERRIVVEYLKAILGRRIKLSNPKDRIKAGEKLLNDQTMLSSLFNKLSPSPDRSACEALIPIAEVIKLQDKSMMSLELSGLASKYTDVTLEQMQALLAIRGDFSATEARELSDGMDLRNIDEYNSDIRLYADVEYNPPTGFFKI